MTPASCAHPYSTNAERKTTRFKQGDRPEDWSAAKRAQKDVDARWTKKHGKNYYGYKLHVDKDRLWGFIRKIEVTTASINDTEVLELILDETHASKDVYADHGYAKRARETELHVQRSTGRTSSAKARRSVRSTQRRKKRNRDISQDNKAEVLRCLGRLEEVLGGWRELILARDAGALMCTIRIAKDRAGMIVESHKASAWVRRPCTGATSPW